MADSQKKDRAMKKHALGLFLAFASMLGFAAIAIHHFDLFGVEVPRPEPVAPENVARLNESQGWPDGWKLNQANWFRHASQGTRILPKAWFMNLRQPSISPFAGKLSDPEYLARFGFAPGEKNPELNPDGLPVGFAIENDFDAPYANPPSTGPVVGLTCAACHTGRLSYRGCEAEPPRELRVEGGSAMINLSAFEKAVGLSIFWTLKLPHRFERFAQDVLRENDPDQKEKLRRELQKFLDAGLSTETYIREHDLGGTPGGFGRTDALGLIGNRVFQPLGEENLIVTDAPTNFPPLWDTAWFDWVQYNASIRMPMVRNIGEALGVGAPVNLDDRRGELFDSTVNVENLRRLEDQLGGEEIFQGLQPPRWNDPKVQAVFRRPIETARLPNGEKLYKLLCERCHLPPRDELKGDAERRPHRFDVWVSDPVSKKTFLRVSTHDLQEIGTDPNQALNFYRRVALFRGQTASAALGLYVVTELIRENKYRQLGLNPAQALAFDRFRSNDPVCLNDVFSGKAMKNVIVANLKYKARPLSGIWATPPFLHNGSVPNLDELLSPAAERSKTFHLGTTLFDPIKVGYETVPVRGDFRLDTGLPGNSNLGHEFRNLSLEELESVPEIWSDDPRAKADAQAAEDARWAVVLRTPLDAYLKLSPTARLALIRDATIRALQTCRVKRDHPFKGVLGPLLDAEQRKDLIEYLKSL